MIKKLVLLAASLLLPMAAHAFVPVRYVQISTNTLTRQNGTAIVAGVDVSTMAVSSATATNLSVSTLTLSTNLITNNSSGTSGYLLQSRGAGLSPLWVSSTTEGSNFILNSGTLQSGATFYVSSGTATNFIASVSTITALSAGAGRIVNVANGSSSSDAATFGQIFLFQAPVSTATTTNYSTTSNAYQPAATLAATTWAKRTGPMSSVARSA